MMNMFQNESFLSSGLILMFLGGALVWLKTIPPKIKRYIQRLFVTIEILDEDDAYEWMQIWLSKKLEKTLSLSVLSKHSRRGNARYFDLTGNKKKEIYFIPSCGTYFFWYKKRLVILSRFRQDNTTSLGRLASVANGLRTKEGFDVRIFTRDKTIAEELLQECRVAAIPTDDKIDIKITAFDCNYWMAGSRIQPRPIESVILEGNMANEILDDIKNFQGGSNWYKNVGVPWRRSYLLEGAPGSGKTSIVKAIAAELKMNIYFLMLSDPDMTDGKLAHLLSCVSEDSILLLEDVDCAFVERKSTSDNENKGLTFAGLLNAIDGIASMEGRITFMTTNHIEKLDPALIRPGRVDVHIHVGNATSNQAERLFHRFFPEQNGMAADFAKEIPDRKYSMAALQNHLMLYKSNPQEALNNIDKIYLPENSSTTN